MDGLPQSVLTALRLGKFHSDVCLEGAIDDLEDAQQLLRQCLPAEDSDDDKLKEYATQLYKYVCSIRDKARNVRRRTAYSSGPDRQSTLNAARAGTPPSLTLVAPRILAGSNTRWKTTRHREATAATTDHQRRDAENSERDRWIYELISLVVEAELPITAEAKTTADPDAALKQIAGRRRAKTIRQRVRTWRKVRSWLLSVHSTPWPTSASQMVDYLTDCIAGGCNRWMPQQVSSALSFLESAGSVPAHLRVSESPFWKNAVANTEMTLQQGAPDTQKAPALIPIVIIALELYVLSDQPKYKRALAWVRLVRTWTAMRSDDTRGLVPRTLTLRDGILQGRLERTKSSGPGRIAKWLPIFVTEACFLAHPRWLAEGFAIWQSEEFAFQRDYLIPLPNAGYTGVQHRIAEYSDLSAMGRSLLCDLALPAVDTEGEWYATGEKLLTPPMHLFWTEHSERNFVASLAAVAGISRSDRDYIGRWRVSAGPGSDDYVRTARQAVGRIQKAVALTALSPDGGRKHEGDVLFELTQFLKGRGYEESEAFEATSRLSLPEWQDHDEGHTSPSPSPSGFADSSGDLGPAGLIEVYTPTADDGAEPTLDRPSTAYWIACSRRRFMRLHATGACHIRPGLDASEWVEVADPDSVLCNTRRKLCWGKRCYIDRDPDAPIAPPSAAEASARPAQSPQTLYFKCPGGEPIEVASSPRSSEESSSTESVTYSGTLPVLDPYQHYLEGPAHF